ncbi:hypothetical protein C8Q78DRAFT_627310 [Trametes maxima]|nr:hypothetical protein C8Q78DRAFT_627310 [Trametes maxima]
MPRQCSPSTSRPRLTSSSFAPVPPDRSSYGCHLSPGPTTRLGPRDRLTHPPLRRPTASLSPLARTCRSVTPSLRSMIMPPAPCPFALRPGPAWPPRRNHRLRSFAHYITVSLTSTCQAVRWTGQPSPSGPCNKRLPWLARRYGS